MSDEFDRAIKAAMDACQDVINGYGKQYARAQERCDKDAWLWQQKGEAVALCKRKIRHLGIKRPEGKADA